MSSTTDYTFRDDASQHVESLLAEEQRNARNLTSFSVYPFPSRLVEVPYPLDGQDCPVEPALLHVHSRTHTFRMPTCYHGEPTCSTIVRGQDQEEGSVHIICGKEYERERCAFTNDLGNLFERGGPLTYAKYNLRPPRSVSTFESSSDHSGSSSFSSLGSTRKRPRTNSPFIPSQDVAIPKDEDLYLPLSDIICNTEPDTSTEVKAGLGPHHQPENSAQSNAILNDKLDMFHQPSSAAIDTALVVANGAPPSTDKNSHATAATRHSIVAERPSERAGHDTGIPSAPSIKVERSIVQNIPATENVDSGSSSLGVSMEVRRARGTGSDGYDSDAYPLLGRKDGTSSPLIRCIDPVTYDFSHDLFLAQIIKDANSGRGNKVIVY